MSKGGIEVASSSRQSQPMRALTSSATNEWYTPRKYIKAARTVLAGIDLDPASSATANQIVKAHRYYDNSSFEMDGLNNEWWGTVFCNPPYGIHPGTGQSMQGLFAEKFVAEHEAGRMCAGILLVNLYAGYQWFEPLREYHRCEVDHLIRFINPNNPDELERGEGTKPAKASSVFFYVGIDPDFFYAIFSQFGVCGQLKYRGVGAI